MRKILISLLLFLSLSVYGENISHITQDGGKIMVYNTQGKKYLTKVIPSETLKGYGSSFFITQKNSWIYLYDSDGKKYKTLPHTSVGEVIGVSGDTFSTCKGEWIFIFDKNGRKIKTIHK